MMYPTTQQHGYVWFFFFCAVLVGIFILPWWAIAVAMVYGAYYQRFEILAPAIVLDAMYMPFLPLWGVVGMPHVVVTIVLLIGFRVLRKNILHPSRVT